MVEDIINEIQGKKNTGDTKIWLSHGYGPKRFFLGQNNEVLSAWQVN